MKKISRFITALALCGVMLFGLVGCGQKNSYFVPQLEYDGIGDITVELVTNKNGDYVLFDESMGKGDPYILEQDGSVTWAWVIKQGNDVKGWICPEGAHGSDGKTYGYSCKDGKVEDMRMVVYLITSVTEEEFKNHFTATSSVGSVEFTYFNESDQFRDYLSASYRINLDGVSAEQAKRTVITIGMHE